MFILSFSTENLLDIFIRLITFIIFPISPYHISLFLVQKSYELVLLQGLVVSRAELGTGKWFLLGSVINLHLIVNTWNLVLDDKHVGIHLGLAYVNGVSTLAHLKGRIDINLVLLGLGRLVMMHKSFRMHDVWVDRLKFTKLNINVLDI